MNSGLLGALGSQPLKTQRFYNRPYGSSLVLSNHIPNFNITTYRTPNLTNWSSNGTMLGINASPTFNGDFINAQINSSDRFKVDSLGSIYMGKTTPSLSRRGDIDLLYLNSIETGTSVAAGGAGLRFGAGSTLLWTHDIPAQTTNTGFSWEGFGALGMRSGTQTQSLRIYNTFTSTTNYERFTIDWQTNPNTCVIATSAAGAGSVRGMEFRVGTTTAMSIASGGNITFGVNGALSTPAITIAGNILSGGSSTTTSPLIDYRPSGSTPNFSTNGTLFGGNLPNGYLGDLFNYRYYNGAALFRVDCNGSLYANYNASFGGSVGSDGFNAKNSINIGAIPGISSGIGIVMKNTDVFSWANSNIWYSTCDLILARDASGVLGQRVGTSSQAYRLYNTFTSSTDYERFTIDWQTKPNTCVIATSAAGAGSVRGMEFRVGTTTAMSIASSGNINYQALQTVDLSGLGTTPSPGIALSNTTTASAGSQQVSPSLTWTGQGWKTNAPTASQTINWRSYVLPVQNVNNPPTSVWKLDYDNGTGTYTQGLTYTPGGSPSLTLGGTGAAGIATIGVDYNGTNISFSSNTLAHSSGGVQKFRFADFYTTNPGLTLGFDNGSYYIGISTATTTTARTNTNSIGFGREASGTIRWGIDDATTPTDQTIKAHNVTTGTGAALTLAGGRGSVAGGAVVLATSETSGAAVTRLRVDSNGVFFISNITIAPSANPVGGGYMFVSAGELKYMGSSGTITTLAPA